MNDLMRRINTIRTACEDPKKAKKKREEDEKLDDFQRLKKRIAEDVRQLRQRIEERDIMIAQTSPGNPMVPRISSDIRTKLQEIEADANSLRDLQKKEAEKVEKQRQRGRAIPEDIEKEMQTRVEIVELCYQHIEECKNLERNNSLQQLSPGSFSVISSKPDGPVPLSLPDIDDERFQQLILTDKLIDERLGVISGAISDLGEIATEMGKELELQTVMLDELEVHVEDTSGKFDNLNKRLKNQLNKIRTCDRFVLDFVCIMTLLGLGGLIYNMVTRF